MEIIHQFNTGVNLYRNDKIAYPPHLHDDIEIVTLFKGKARVTVVGQEYLLSDGDAVAIFPNAVHSFVRISENVETGKIIFSPDEVPELKNELLSGLPIHPIIKSDVMEKMGIISLVDEILREYEASSAPVRRAYLTLLTGKILALPSLSERTGSLQTLTGVSAQIIEYCKRNFRENITISSVAKAVFVSYDYVSRIFSHKLKINFRTYINGLRLNHATKLLSEGNSSVTEIAYECGFSCLRTFNRVFSGAFGCSPKAYVAKKNQAIKI